MISQLHLEMICVLLNMYIQLFFTKVKNWVRSNLYRQETGFMLNYLTLSISNENIR